jgi:hypothetical protein
MSVLMEIGHLRFNQPQNPFLAKRPVFGWAQSDLGADEAFLDGGGGAKLVRVAGCAILGAIFRRPKKTGSWLSRLNPIFGKELGLSQLNPILNSLSMFRIAFQM